MNLGAVVPAAGLSRRMGREKVLLPFGKSTMLGTVLAKLREAGVERVVVVVRPDLPEAAALVRTAGAVAVENPRPEGEMIESIRLGLAALPAGLDAFFVWPADHPAVSTSTLRHLAERASKERAVLPVTGGRRGHPALVGAELGAAIWGLIPEGGQIPPRDGLRRLWRDRAEAVEELEVEDPGILENLDDPDTYAQARLRDEGGKSSGGTGVP